MIVIKIIRINKMNMKNKTLYLALMAAAITGTVSYAEYTVVINPDKSSISFSKPQWIKTDPKFIGWADPATDNEFYRYECKTWTPKPETVESGKKFTQTATDCKGKQFAQMIDQELNNTTNKLRDVGEPYIDSKNEKVLTDLTNTKESVGTQSVYLTIINPVQGQSRIYQISDGKSGSFPAYVNMTDDGGQWILVARWAADPSVPLATWNDLGVKGNKMLTYSNNASNYPVVPSNSINASSKMLVKNYNTSWTATFGTWQSFSTFNASTVIGPSGFSANTSIGAKTLFIRANGWNTIVPQDMTSVFGLFNTYGNGGVCGGNNRVGPNPMCISYTNSSGSHFDLTSIKEVYIKALN